MLKKHKIWRKTKLRLFVVVDIEDDIKQIEKSLHLWLIDNHYLIYKIEFIQADVSFYFPKSNCLIYLYTSYFLIYYFLLSIYLINSRTEVIYLY